MNSWNVPLNIFGGMVVVVVLKSMHIKFCWHNDFPSPRSFIEKKLGALYLSTQGIIFNHCGNQCMSK